MAALLSCVPSQISLAFSQNFHSSPVMNLFMFTKYSSCCRILLDYINGGVTLWLRVTGTLLPSPVLMYEHRTLLSSHILMYEHRTLLPSPILMYEHKTLLPSPILMYELRTLLPSHILMYEHITLLPSPVLMYDRPDVLFLLSWPPGSLNSTFTICCYFCLFQFQFLSINEYSY